MRNARGLLALVCCTAVVFSLQCGSDEGPGPEPVHLTISPRDMDLGASSSQQFTADVGGQPVVDANWFVNGVRGGNPETGMVTAVGLYISPSDVPSGDYVTLTARAVVEGISYRDSIRVTITKPAGTPCVTVSPDTVAVIQLDVVVFSDSVPDCASDSVTWSLSRLWGSNYSLGSISPAGVYEAPPSGSNSFAVMVQASSVGCPTKVGIAKVVFYPSDWPDIELESFNDSFDVPGSATIQAASCGGASGGRVVEGLDNGGEWVKVPVYIPVAGVYQVFVRCQTEAGDTIGVRVTMEDCGAPVPETDFVLYGGDGLG